MPWTNGPIVVFHGTDNISAAAIRKSGIDKRLFRSQTDFGAGFYVTSFEHQARQWANQRCRRLPGGRTAAVIGYSIERDDLEQLKHLCFSRDSLDYYDFVAYCRSGSPNHGPSPRSASYAIVYGPVSLWPQRLIIADCDQILFTDPCAIKGFATPIAVQNPAAGATFF